MDQILVSGAREHNLKDVTVAIPRDSLTVITGLSGSGKSSLAFDTIYAEGQRRYVESLSAYARQFLGQMDKPDVDSIEGLSPAISIDQKTTSRNPRSTVGTVTEIYDYLRLLWSRIGHPHCHICGRPISGQSAEQIIDQVMELDEGTRFMVLAPIVRGRKGEYGKQFEELRAEGFGRVKVDGELRRLDEQIVLDKKFKHDIAVVVDRLVMKGELRKRLADSIETAVALADGLVEIELVDPPDAGPDQRREDRILTFSERFACPVHGPSLVELEPRIFSFNSPHGACPRCTGLGSQMEIDPDLVVPDPTLSIGEGAIAPWAVSASNYYDQLTQAIAERYDVELDTPWQDLPEESRDFFLFGTGGERVQVSYRNRFGRRRSYATRFEGIV
ncbi:MAG TPA: excinuclease ABC subunit UvrA, partial [Solirubrobacteraceae bacterium]